ncbi:phenylacetate--CoA ligase family protein [uncultured Pseudodesulfovibrio sp.]|uniref:phenylacetate--CoA ligase family protein n=1 Tax=uncultured Pseudodesulfovibrio sp. TaxID=2035858 RepID=UPI0029C5FCB0|nr:phenylacetate--CoA ligase family protein [uncultured Pseudodesulfovibrio sp.]
MSKQARFEGDLFSSVSRNFFAPLWAKYEGSPYLTHLKRFEKTQYADRDDMLKWQWEKLAKLFQHAVENTAFYKEKYKGCRLESLNGLGKLPLLTKDEIRSRSDDMIAKGYDKSSLFRMKTSGSTGVSLELFMDEDSLQWKRGCTVRHDMWTGWKFGERVGAIWGNPEQFADWRAWLRNLLLLRHIPLDTLKMDEAVMDRYHETLRRKRPTVLFGHAHSLYLFAKYCESKGYDDIRPKGIISTAMVLHDFERVVLERVFDCGVYNRYGCEEVSLIGSECDAHSGLHVNMDTLVVEVVDGEGRPLPEGEAGAIVVTDLTNMAMPVIRYKVGDVGVLSNEFCPCGRTAPLITSLQGRIADYVQLTDGSYVSGISLTENFHMALPGVKQLQIVQEELDRLTFRIVPAGTWKKEDATALDGLIRKRFGATMRYDVELVASIQSEDSGKYRFCISKLGEQPF